MRLSTAARVAILAGLVLSAAAACGGGARPAVDKAGAEATFSLTVATPDSAFTPGAAWIKDFATRVTDVSSGRVQVHVQYEAVGGATDFEAKTIEQVRNGTFDLGWIGARAWDTQGVTTFQALQAPFLITSYPLLDAVLASPIAGQMLAGLEPAGFVGLGIYPGELRHPVGFRRPFLTPADFGGARFRVPGSKTTDALVRALGAEPVHLNGTALADAISNGDLAGAETSIGDVAALPASSIMTANVTFFPKTFTLFLSKARYDSLPPTARDALNEAARRTLVFALGADPESKEVADFCKLGGTLVTASDRALDDFGKAGETVTTMIDEDPATTSLVGQIRTMKSSLPAGADAGSVPRCPSGASPQP